jgi:AcrR family transcriptional regulator
MTISRQKKGLNPTSRHQEKTDITRARFLQAAEKIFARDGFDAAKLEEIAAEAGYTRGAFYANFDTKEDLFLALLEREISSRIANLRKHVAKYESPWDKLQALRDFWLDMCLDRRWSLLALEFKLFAVRHPEVKTRLVTMHRRLVSSGVELLQQIMDALGRKLPASAHAVGIAFFVLSSGLTMEHMLDRTVMPEETVRRLLLTFFDAMMAEGHGAAVPWHGKQVPRFAQGDNF